jgi:hypothetical protein
VEGQAIYYHSFESIQIAIPTSMVLSEENFVEPGRAVI